MLLRPEWNRTCGDCRQWVHEDGDGTPAERRGRIALYAGERAMRPPHSPTPCYKCPKIPDEYRRTEESAGRRVTYRDAIEPEDWHREAVERILEGHAAGFGNEPSAWMRRLAAIVRPVIAESEQRHLRDLVALLTVQATTRRK